ncbi:hypothetical protein ONZ45_g17808 [Pleurotus djamor]|nr:hypothetical protein ONZ45_g17808 [Pleurotus djamor]
MPPRRNSGLAATRASARLARADPVASDNAMPSIPGGLDAGSVSGDEPVAPVESTPRPSRVRSGDEVPGDSPRVLLQKPEGDVPSKDDGSVRSTPSGENTFLPQADEVPRRLSLPQADKVPRHLSLPQADEVPRRMLLAQADEVPQPFVARTKGASGSVPQERGIQLEESGLSAGQLEAISQASQSLSPGERVSVDARNRAIVQGDVYITSDNEGSLSDDEMSEPVRVSNDKGKGKAVEPDNVPEQTPKTFFEKVKPADMDAEEYERGFNQQIQLAMALSLKDLHEKQRRVAQPGASTSGSLVSAVPEPSPEPVRVILDAETRAKMDQLQATILQLQNDLDFERAKSRSLSVGASNHFRVEGTGKVPDLDQGAMGPDRDQAPRTPVKSVRIADDNGFVPVYRSKGRAKVNRSPSPTLVPVRGVGAPAKEEPKRKVIGRVRTITPMSDESDSEASKEDAILPSSQLPRSSALGSFLRRSRNTVDPGFSSTGGRDDDDGYYPGGNSLMGGAPRLKPLKPTPYDGSTESGKLQKFIREVEAYLRDGNVHNETAKVRHIGSFLTGHAGQFYEMMVAPCIDEWDMNTLFTELVNFCFPSDFRESERIRLNKIYQNDDTVKMYATRLVDCMNTCGGLSKRDKIVRLWMGLRKSIRAELTREGLSMFASSWDRIMMRAEIIEVAQSIYGPNGERDLGGNRSSRKHHDRRDGGGSSNTSENRNGGSSSGNGGRDVNSHRDGNARNSRGRQHGWGNNDRASSNAGDDDQRRLHGMDTSTNHDDMDELRAQKRCYLCKEIGHVQRNCPGRQTVSGLGDSRRPPGIPAHSVSVEADGNDDPVLHTLEIGFLGLPWSFELSEGLGSTARRTKAESNTESLTVNSNDDLPDLLSVSDHGSEREEIKSWGDDMSFSGSSCMDVDFGVDAPSSSVNSEILQLFGQQVPAGMYPAILRDAAVTKGDARSIPMPIVVTVNINNQPATALLDSGSLGDFMSLRFAERLKLKTFELNRPLPVQLAVQGSRSHVNCGCKARLEYQDIDESRYFDIIDLSKYDLILGTPWLFQHRVTFGVNPSRVVIGSAESLPLEGDRVTQLVSRSMGIEDVSEGANTEEGGRRKQVGTAAWTCSHERGENNATRGSADPKVTPSWNRVKQELNIIPPPSFHGDRLTPTSHIPKHARLPQHFPQVPNSTPAPSTRIHHQTPYIFHLFRNISRPHANRWLLRTPSNGDVYAFDRRTLTAILDVAQWLHTGDLRPEQLEGEARRVYNMVAQTVLAETRIRGKLPYYNVHGVFNNVKWVLRKHLLGLAPPSYQRKRNLRLQNARSVVTGGRGHAFGRRRDWGNNPAVPPAESVSITTTPATRIKNAVASSSKESWNGVGDGAEAIKDLDGMEDTLEHWGMEDFDLPGNTAEEDDDFVEVLSSSVAAGKKHQENLIVEGSKKNHLKPWKARGALGERYLHSLREKKNKNPGAVSPPPDKAPKAGKIQLPLFASPGIAESSQSSQSSQSTQGFESIRRNQSIRCE